MGWKSFVHKVAKPLNTVFNPVQGMQDLGNYAKDFKDWYDGTAAMRKQNDLNVQNWDMVNAYNTPEAQMQRYAAAGLNPNLIYSQSNTAGQIASASMPETGANTLNKAAQTIASMYNLKMLAAQVANVRKQNTNIDSQNNLLTAQADYTKEQARRYAWETEQLQTSGAMPGEWSVARAARGAVKNGIDLLNTPDYNPVNALEYFNPGAYLAREMVKRAKHRFERASAYFRSR